MQLEIYFYNTYIAVELDADGNVLRYKHEIEEENEEPEMQKVKDTPGNTQIIKVKNNCRITVNGYFVQQQFIHPKLL